MLLDNVAFITGISGQDGSYLAELLLSKGYTVHGMIRRSSSINTQRLDGIYQDPHESSRRLHLHYGDLSDGLAVSQLIHQIRPDEIYNLGAQSHVRVSYDIPEYTTDIVATGTIRLLEAARQLDKEVRFYQASSSEMFGSTPPPQNETAAFHPRSPYAVAKVFAHHATVNYRESYGMHASCGILFNHESERRGETFVTRKIAKAAARIALGLQDVVYLGNLDAKRDWGYAPDFVEAMWRIVRQPTPNDYVIATGKAHTVQQFCEKAFEHLGLDWQRHVRFDERYLRPAEVDHLRGDYSKAHHSLGWRPTTEFAELVVHMVDAEHQIAQRGALV